MWKNRKVKRQALVWVQFSLKSQRRCRFLSAGKPGLIWPIRISKAKQPVTQTAAGTERRRSQRSTLDKDASQEIKLSFRTVKKADWSHSEGGERRFHITAASGVCRAVWSTVSGGCMGENVLLMWEVRGQNGQRPPQGYWKWTNRWLRPTSVAQLLWTHILSSCDTLHSKVHILHSVVCSGEY